MERQNNSADESERGGLMKMWNGRFTKSTDALMDTFNNSLLIDIVLIVDDIQGSIAWAHALEKAGVLSAEEAERISEGLQTILKEYYQDTINFKTTDEDIHMAVERLLTEKIGDTGARLHTGRSRNDQVVTGFRRYIKRSLLDIVAKIERVQEALLKRAEIEKATVMPGYTHLQQAQPVSMAQYWLSFFFLLERDKKRCRQAAECADCMPLGAGACAGSGFDIDREALAKELGFSRVSENSMDAVAARDFVLETLAACASLGIHCSRYAEDLIIWSSEEFGFISLDDAWATGSSMMPQKKNPDSLELIRGKSGRFIGNYTRFAATLKGVGMTYFKDLQEDKEPVIDSITQLVLVLSVFSEVIATLTVNAQNITDKMDPFLFATDVADYLAEKGVPFRNAHAIVGNIVKHCITKGIAWNDLSVETLKEFSEKFESDIKDVFKWDSALARRNIQGGTGPESIEKQIAQAKSVLNG